MSSQDISEEEAALYDRQIRLWGLEAQAKLKKAKLLLIGLPPVAAEIIKNIVLCGVDTLTLCDDKVVDQNDIEQCFLYEGRHRNISAVKRVRALNEVVNIRCEKITSPDFLAKEYQGCDEVIIAVEGAFKHWTDYAMKFTSRPNRPKIHCVMSFGMHAVGFTDLGCYTYDGDDCKPIRNSKPATDSPLPAAPNGNKNWSTVEYPSLKTFFEVNWHANTNAPLVAKRMPKGFYLTRLISELNCPISIQNLKEIWPWVAENLGVSTSLLSDDDFESCCGPSPVAINAIIGGIISQEIVQGLSHKGEPRGNWYFVDGRSCEVTVLWLPKRP
ncbi:SUMO activating enzyme subunit 1 [Echinococcus multilocularis]|uniref:SUMO activating enzyme subunit 1 n=1 Tax=Echinococcus multilocularis TaxID=6211 RepID=A0A068YC56_ECHMU|nr:SUMO activating enzyme subunit 1 [Echinococcus multilocularis]